MQSLRRGYGGVPPSIPPSPPPPLPERSKRLGSQAMSPGAPQLNVAPANNLVMPVFPLRPTPSPYSPYSPSRFHIDKRCQHRCTWKCCSIALILLSVALTAMLAYFGAVNTMRPGLDSTSCILVEDAKAVAQDEHETRDATSSQAPTEESLPTSTAVLSNGPNLANKSPGSSTDQTLQQQSQQQWPLVVEIREFSQPRSATIPPYQFWNSEFRNKQPAFIRLNFTLPWGANFAVYGRRNVAPSVTQYDFVEFVKSGRIDNRIKRSVSGLDAFGREDFLSSASAAVSFTTLTTQKWHHRLNSGEEALHVIPAPPFIVNHNHLERSPNSDLDSEVTQNPGNENVVQSKTTSESPTTFLFDDLDDLNDPRDESEATDPPAHNAPRNNNERFHSYAVKRGTHKKFSDSGSFNSDTESHKYVDMPLAKDHKVSKRSSGTESGNESKAHNVSKRSGLPQPTIMLVNVTLLQYLDTGRWFLSVYNDDLRPHEVTLIVAEAEGVSTACPNDCSGHGSCYLGKCDCIDGYEGIDCSKSVCPVLCSNHGKYGGGLCHCEEGWKGTECDIPERDCQVPDCSGNGQCLTGVCVCRPGWKGSFCEQVDCADPTCSNHGSCVGGKCYCKAGWQGANCSVVDQQVYQCLPGCSEHGSYDLDSGSCICENYWTGSDCSQALCSLDCGPHGWCDKGRCECHEGWTGDMCDLLPCDPRCSEHGQCKNGTCVCSQGWNGRHCTLPGCKSACNNHGICKLKDGDYRCVCSDGWAGPDCSIRLEMDCTDDIDNDEDGMKDCSDSECCSYDVCVDHIMCLASNDPVDVLLRKQPPLVTATFYHRVKFLIEENSVQSYAHLDAYSESRVSVIRGQAVTHQGLGILGIRVSVEGVNRSGFTLTRQGGWFDVLVNGGGAVELRFQKSPYEPITKTVFVPWNRIVFLPPVAMSLSTDNEGGGHHPGNLYVSPDLPGSSMPLFSQQMTPCLDHDHELLNPIVMSTWMPEKVGGVPGRSVVFAETQILQESIRIPGSSLNLLYQSSRAPGYLSRVLMKLTHDAIPQTLTHVHVRVEIEGSVHSRTYEADPHLTHTFAWNKRNVYNQKVYGVGLAHISVGYQHSTCHVPVWETRTATLQGFNVDISDIGGWGLDIHHHYNFNEGILQKGDGTTLHLKQYPRTVKVVMGTGIQRPLKCADCNGVAKDSRLLTPVALTSGPDGSLYVGDFNLVRRVTPEGNVHTVLQLPATQVAYRYYLSISPADGHLYVSDPEKHQILRALSLDPVEEPSINYEPIVGSGERCIPGDETQCGDEGPARDAKLAHPKGLAIAADKTMYIADGTNIRAVDPKGIIHTIVGHHGHHNHWMPVPCQGAIPVQEAQLQWPTGLALSPLDGSLHFIDDRLVLKLTGDMKVKVVAGVPLHCHTCLNASQHPKQRTASGMNGSKEDFVKVDNKEEDTTKATGTTLGSVLAIAFSPTGDLFIAESDSRKVNAIWMVDSAGRLTDFAGRQQEKLLRMQSCECNVNGSTSTPAVSPCFCPTTGSSVDETLNVERNSKETMLSSNAQFTSISALTVSPNGVLHVADQGSLHILALEHYLPVQDESTEFRIPYPPTGEIYIFNRFGQHIATKDLTSGRTLYTFLYSKNTSFGKLSTVSDSSKNEIIFRRDYSNIVSTIENTQDHKSDLKISGIGFLVKFSEKGESEIELEYDSLTGLLTSRSDYRGGGGGQTFMYRYGEHGRLTDVILPTGETLNFASQLTANYGLDVHVEAPLQSLVSPNGNLAVTFKMEGRGTKSVYITEGTLTTEAVTFRNGSFSIESSWGGHLHCSSVAHHPLLELSLPVEAEMMPMWSQQVMTLGDGPVNSAQWTYTLVGDVRGNEQTLHRELWVNQSRVLGIEFDQANGKETFYDRDQQSLLTIAFNPAGLPQSWTPAKGWDPVEITYDRFNRVNLWKWGRLTEEYNYESHGLLSEIVTHDGSTKFTYNELNMLSHILLPSLRRFTLQYDESGGLRHVIMPSGTRHSFSCQPSLGFLRVSYTPPGSTRAYVQHYTHRGALLQTIYPGDGARVVYRYHTSGQLAEVIHGDGHTQFNYSPTTGFPSEVVHTERDFEYRWDYQYQAGLLTEERLDFGAKTGLSNAKFTYEYDANFRLVAIQGRIGGQTLTDHNLAYNSKTGAPEQVGQFKISKTQNNKTLVFDGTAIFSHMINSQFELTQLVVTIHSVEVLRMEFTYNSCGQMSRAWKYTRNVGVNTYTNVKNYTWDYDGQLTNVDGQDSWTFKYDPNGNLLHALYRGGNIPIEYDAMDRIVKANGPYRHDNRGFVIQNAKEERFQYNAKGLLVKATKRGRFDVRYYYDHLDRLVTRKDNYGNVTQFFYTNHHRPNEVSHIYSPRDGKLMTLTYDDRGHLIFAQVYRHKYYIATDHCGTPIMIFNQYGEGVREMTRAPYGHIVYDSNPYIYLPIDFCGGLLDSVTTIVFLPNGKAYDPIFGQFLTPNWEGVLDRVSNPKTLPLYRFNGNDPINMKRQPQHLTEHESWLSLLGYDLRSLSPQLYPKSLPGGGLPPNQGFLGLPAVQDTFIPNLISTHSSIQLKETPPNQFTVTSGFLAHLAERRLGDVSTLHSPPRSGVKRDPWPPKEFPATNPASVFTLRQLGAASDPPFGRGILVSRTAEGQVIVSSAPSANAIYRDVFTSVFNQSYLLPFTFLVHNAQQDAFYFVKEDTWRATEDRGQLNRLGGQVNITFHEKEAGASESTNGKVADLKIHSASAVINLRYGTTLEKEKQRLLHHARTVAIRKAWHKEKEALGKGFAGTIDWAQAEVDEILKVGYTSSYEGKYVHDVQKYPELAEDPFNIRFVKKTATATATEANRHRRKRSLGMKRNSHFQSDNDEEVRSFFYANSNPNDEKVNDSGDAPINKNRMPFKNNCFNKRWWLPWTPHSNPSC